MSAHSINLHVLSDDVLLEWWRRWYDYLIAEDGGSWFVISAQVQAAAMLAEIDQELKRRGIEHERD